MTDHKLTPQEKLQQIKAQHEEAKVYTAFDSRPMDWLIARVEHLERALKSISKWEQYSHAPEHELRHAIGVEIPYEANMALEGSDDE